MDRNIQGLFELLKEKHRVTRSETQMTLGEFIQILKGMEQSVIVNVDHLSSYRGYYSDLALAPAVDDTGLTVAELLKLCDDAVDAEFRGYKGGEFFMGADTPLWLSPYGTASNKRIVGIEPDGTIVTELEFGH